MQTHKTARTDKQTLPDGLTTLPGCPVQHRSRQPDPQRSPYALAENEDAHNASQMTELEDASTIGMLAPTMRVAPAEDGLDALRQLLSSDRLNVIGEEHLESGRRRHGEELIARSIAKGGYWQEHEFINEDDSGNRIVGDPWDLRVKQNLTYLKMAVLPKIEKENNAITQGVYSFQLTEVMSDLYGEIHIIESEYRHHAAENAPEKTFEEIKTSDSYYKLLTEALNNTKKIHKYSDEHLTVDEKITSLMKGLIENVTEIYTSKLADSDDFTSIRKERSEKMHISAEKFYRIKGIWKIGDDHLVDIKETKDAFKYNLIRIDSFNKAWTEKIRAEKQKMPSPEPATNPASRPGVNPNHIKTKQKKSWCAGFPCCCLGWCR